MEAEVVDAEFFEDFETSVSFVLCNFNSSFSCSSLLDCLNLLGNGGGMERVLIRGDGVLTWPDGSTGNVAWESSFLVKGRASGEELVTDGNDVVDTFDGLANNGSNCFSLLRDIALAFSFGLISG